MNGATRITDMIDLVAKIRKPKLVGPPGQRFAPVTLVAWGELRAAAFELELHGAYDQVAWAREDNVEAMVYSVLATKHHGAGELLDSACGAFLFDVRQQLAAAAKDGDRDARTMLATMGVALTNTRSVYQAAEVGVTAATFYRSPASARKDLAHRIYMNLPIAPMGFAAGGFLSDPKLDTRLIVALQEHTAWFTTPQQRTFLNHVLQQYQATGALSDMSRAYGLRTLRTVGAWVA